MNEMYLLKCVVLCYNELLKFQCNKMKKIGFRFNFDFN